MRPLTLACALVATIGAQVAAADRPLGHADFMPSSEHPVGWRGDGNGAFAAASCPRPWSEGTIERGVIKVRDKKGRKVSEKKLHHLTEGPLTGIRWRTEMPGWGNSQPIVVGDKVFVTAEPNFLVCCDRDDGEILWQDRLNPFVLKGTARSQAEADRYQAALNTVRACHIYCRAKAPGEKEIEKYSDARLEPILARLEEFALTLDPILPEVATAIRDYRDKLERRDLGHGSGKGPAKAIRDHYGMRGYDSWMGMVGWTFATPVSDGERVYATMGQGQVGCWDLDGKRLWGAFVDASSANTFARVDHVPSPILIGDRLFAWMSVAVVVYDKHTGKELGRLENEGQVGYRCGSAKVVTLASGRKVLALPSGNVYDPQSLELLCKLGTKECGGEAGGSSVVCSGDIVFIRSGSNRKSTGHGIRLAEKDGQVIAETLWSNADALGENSNPTPVAHDGRFIVQASHKLFVLDAETGKVLAKRKADACSTYTKASGILIGNRFITLDEGSYPYTRKRLDDWIDAEQRIYTITSSGIEGGARAMLGGRYKPPVPCMQQALPDLYEDGMYSNYGIPAQFGYGSPFAQGGHIYLRSNIHLYCIGP